MVLPGTLDILCRMKPTPLIAAHRKFSQSARLLLLACAISNLTPASALPFLTSSAELQARPEETGRKPNFLLILTDDHGYGDVSAYRKADLQTPHIDRIGTEGMRFSAIRANATVCSPTRAAILTGCYADRVGVPGVIRTHPQDSWGWFSPTAPTLGDNLRKAGYQTALVGKWHLGLEQPNTPNDRGFDFFHGFLGDMMDNYRDHRRHGQNYLRLNREVIEPEGHATDLFAKWAVDWLRERSRSKVPFFLFLAFNAPHFPIEPPAQWLDRVRQRQPGLDEKRARNVAFVEHLDDAIGKVLAALDETGLDKSTLVVFTSDNGGSLPHAQNNHVWRDGKQSHYDGGLRVPFLVRWPGMVKPGTHSNYPGLTFDIFPTFLELAGEGVPAGLDAVSLAGLLLGGSAPSGPRDLYFVRREGGLRYGGNSYEAIIRGDWKLLRNDPYSSLELYNLADDPQETKDLAAAQPKIFQELSVALRAHIQRGGATPWQPPLESPGGPMQ
jgi:arylsulfatase A-like enzyme